MPKFEVDKKPKRHPKSLNITDRANTLLVELAEAYGCSQAKAVETLIVTYVPSLLRQAPESE